MGEDFGIGHAALRLRTAGRGDLGWPVFAIDTDFVISRHEPFHEELPLGDFAAVCASRASRGLEANLTCFKRLTHVEDRSFHYALRRFAAGGEEQDG